MFSYNSSLLSLPIVEEASGDKRKNIRTINVTDVNEFVAETEDNELAVHEESAATLQPRSKDLPSVSKSSSNVVQVDSYTFWTRIFLYGSSQHHRSFP